ncbi:MAG: hypothetical protein WBQ75_10415 [Acetobacteraceae bacterium]
MGSGAPVALATGNGTIAGALDLFGHSATTLWRAAAQAPAAEALKLTAEDLHRLPLTDAVAGRAHRAPEEAARARWGRLWRSNWPRCWPLDGATLRARRREKLLEMGRDTAG